MESRTVNTGLRHLQAWFVTGSQHLYGEAVLERVGEHARAIAACLDESADIPVQVVAKPVVTTPDGPHAVAQQAYYRVDGDRISYLRVMCSGFRPIG